MVTNSVEIVSPTSTTTNIDTKWFQERIRDKRTSQRQLAFKMGLDPAAMSLLLNGKRGMNVHEAATLAVLLGQPLHEVLTRAGVEALPKGGKLRPGAVGPQFVVTGKPASETSAETPGDVYGLIPLRVEDVDSHYYGWTFYYQPRADISADCIGRLCVVKTAKETAIRFVKRSLGKGRMLLECAGEVLEANVLAASPVVWIRP